MAGAVSVGALLFSSRHSREYGRQLFIYNSAIFAERTHLNDIYDMVAKSIGDDTNNKQLLILPFDN